MIVDNDQSTLMKLSLMVNSPDCHHPLISPLAKLAETTIRALDRSAENANARAQQHGWNCRGSAKPILQTFAAGDGVQMAGDGDCLFHALGIFDGYDGAALRIEAAGHKEVHAAEQEAFEEWLTEASKLRDSEWGGDTAIATLATGGHGSAKGRRTEPRFKQKQSIGLPRLVFSIAICGPLFGVKSCCKRQVTKSMQTNDPSIFARGGVKGKMQTTSPGI